MFAGTDHVFSAVLFRGMITGPFSPGAPRWIWATVPANPEVVTLPKTDRSMRTVMVPLPVAAVLTEGTSCLPLSMTFEPEGAGLDAAAHPAMTSAAAPMLLARR